MPTLLRKRNEKLALYAGRTKEGYRRLMGNLLRSVKCEPIGEQKIPAHLPQPKIDLELPMVPPSQTLLHNKYARAVLTKDEYDIFCKTWVEWFEAHPEWTTPEDIDDVKQICMETVIQFRLQQMQQMKPTMNISGPYDQSYKRKQIARANLTARRVDKIGTKNGNTPGTMNIAVLAGSKSTDEMAKTLEKQHRAEVQEDIKFLEGTVVRQSGEIKNQ